MNIRRILTSMALQSLILIGSALPALAQPSLRFAFGSCNDQKKPQDYWQSIIDTRPDVFIWTGDNVYADTDDPAIFRAVYDLQLGHPQYQALMRSVPSIIGTWDDHDYGKNDGGKEFHAKELAKSELFRFLDIPDDDPARARDGVYMSRVFGSGTQRVKVILLDTRWFRDPLTRTAPPNPRYLPSPDGDVLGEEQWNWLREELSANEADFHVIVSSIQVVAQEHRFEKWANFPAALDRLYRLLGETTPNRPIFVSGDRHVSEISAERVEGFESPVIDITSSGLTNVWSGMSDEVNSRALGPKIGVPNFGMIEFDWTTEAPRAILSIRDMNGRTVQSVEVR
jgi:alkaline phosphatase D